MARPKRKTPPENLSRADSERRRLMRMANTMATYRYSQTGALKERDAPKPITLPRLKFMEGPE